MEVQQALLTLFLDIPVAVTGLKEAKNKDPWLVSRKNGKMIMVFAQSWTMSDLILAGLSLRSGGQGFSWANMNVAAGLIHRKIEERYSTKRIL